jgi:hypothetical protein
MWEKNMPSTSCQSSKKIMNAKGIRLAWDYEKRKVQVHLYMPGYVRKAHKQFQHIFKKKQNQPFPHKEIIYGDKKQYATQESTAPPATKDEKKFIQKVCGKFLFYGRAVGVKSGKGNTFKGKHPLPNLTRVGQSGLTRGDRTDVAAAA